MHSDTVTLEVDLGDRSYAIAIGSGLMSNTTLLKQSVTGDQALIVTNETVAPLYLQSITDALALDQLDHVILPDGEKYKQIGTIDLIYDELIKRRHNRTTTLIALGGGVIGDMTGFAAATYQRGVNFVQIPTTLLSQVDSSVGGKTGVNHAHGKNMIGAFHQPQAVFIDTDSLRTLPNREYSAGLAEVIKYGLICDVEFFEWLEKHIEDLCARDENALRYAIARSCQNKATIVAQDERESGIRAILNLGHTFGHAIETATNYEVWLHGEAVALGMLMALDLSARQNSLSQDDCLRAASLVRAAGLPTSPPAGLPDSAGMVKLMGLDKKVRNGQLRLVLLRGVGDAIVTDDFEHENLIASLDTGLLGFS